jgi:hypothetical protein
LRCPKCSCAGSSSSGRLIVVLIRGRVTMG